MKQKKNFSYNYNQISVLGKFGKRLLLERNLGNNCLNVWGRHIRRSEVIKITAWLIKEWNVEEFEIEDALNEQH